MDGALTAASTALDLVLAAALVWTASRALGSEKLLTAIALFVAFGFLMTLVWVRLRAPDVALAEAGIGAGFTGALLLAAIGRLHAMQADGKTGRSDSSLEGDRGSKSREGGDDGTASQQGGNAGSTSSEREHERSTLLAEGRPVLHEGKSEGSASSEGGNDAPTHRRGGRDRPGGGRDRT